MRALCTLRVDSDESVLTSYDLTLQNHVWMDVTRHNSLLPPLAVRSPECLGLLQKYEALKASWAQLYCVLKDGCLYLYSGLRAPGAYGTRAEREAPP